MTDDRVSPRRDTDADAEFASFYATWWPRAARWAAGLCGDAQLGEEVAQQALLNVGSRFGAIEDPERYLRRSVLNVSRDVHRSSARRAARERRSVTMADQPSADAADMPDLEVLAALEELTPPQRAVLVLRYWADWDEATIAEALGCSGATVRSHAKRALDQLRSQLEERR